MPNPLPASFLARPFAHRGLHDRAAGRIENSVPAFDAAVAGGYGIELDVQLSADGRAVVFHDPTLERLTGKAGPVRDRTATDLEGIPLNGTEATIPLLADVLDRIAGRVPLLIELKDQSGDLGPSNGQLEAAVADDLARYRWPAAIMSFNPSMVAAMARLAPGVPRGLTTDAFAAREWPDIPPERLAALRHIDVSGVDAAFVSHDNRDLASKRISELHAAGLPILTWTVRSAAEAADALKVAHAITFEGYLPDTPGMSA